MNGATTTLARAASALGQRPPWLVQHVKLDTGMRRIDFEIGCGEARLSCPACGTVEQPIHDLLRRSATQVNQVIRVMVFNRLCNADSKLGTLRWLQTVAMPGVKPSKFTAQHLLSAQRGGSASLNRTRGQSGSAAGW